MPDNSTIGNAYIQIKPSMDGISGEVEKALGDAGSTGASSFGSSFANGIKKAGAVAAAATTAAAGAVTALTKSAVSSYADYEQLVGGVETLFGAGGKELEEFAETYSVTAREIENSGVDWEKYADSAWLESGFSGILADIKYNIEDLGSSAEELADYLSFEYDLDMDDAIAAVKAYQDAATDEAVQAKYEALMEAQETVLNNAAQAYQTAGLSANDYIETVTGFAASLKQSTESELEAAQIADLAVIDMADNANKMGSSMESIQNAYAGFAKQNYTMLDNLNTMGALAA